MSSRTCLPALRAASRMGRRRWTASTSMTWRLTASARDGSRIRCCIRSISNRKEVIGLASLMTADVPISPSRPREGVRVPGHCGFDARDEAPVPDDLPSWVLIGILFTAFAGIVYLDYFGEG